MTEQKRTSNTPRLSRKLRPKLKAMPLKFLFIWVTTFISGTAFGSVLEGVVSAATAYDKISNKYFYAVLALWPAMLWGVAKLRGGEKLTPAMSKSVAGTMWCINAVCFLFLAIHFSPEMSIIFDSISNFIGRIF